MRKISLLCLAGMSTSMLEMKMKKAAEADGYACEICAYPLTDLKKVPADSDIILLGPQASFEEENVKKVFSCPVRVIDMKDYGLMDGAAVLKKAREVLGD